MNPLSHTTSVIELSQSALVANLAFIRSHLHAGTRLVSVVKGNAYGHGLREFVTMALRAGVDHFATFSADEAWTAAQVDDRRPDLMIMGEMDTDQMAWAIREGHSFFVFSLDRLEKAGALAEQIGQPARVHLEAETGMNRTGMTEEELIRAVDWVRARPDRWHWSGLCTHLAGAESLGNYVRIKKQQHLFRKLEKRLLDSHTLQPDHVHAACSAALLRYPQTQGNLVRIGILQYGFFPSRETMIEYVTRTPEPLADPLKRIISWKSRIMDVKNVGAGEYVGYGSSWLTNAPTRIAVIPVGYGHGYSRTLSNQGRVLIRGHRVNLVGMVNMNLIQADVTEVPGATAGDEVILIGCQGDQEISVSSFSEFSDQINYELLTRLPQAIERRIIP